MTSGAKEAIKILKNNKKSFVVQESYVGTLKDYCFIEHEGKRIKHLVFGVYNELRNIKHKKRPVSFNRFEMHYDRRCLR